MTDWPATIAICAATLLGPIFAVVVTRWNDDRRATRDRRMTLFRILMGTRRIQLSNEHVGALNLIEVEFADEPEILQAWKDLVAHLASTANQPTPQDWSDRLETLKGKLLSKIAKKLGFDATNLDVFRGGYAPNAWGQNEQRQDFLWRYLYDLANHKNALPVTPHQPPPGPEKPAVPTTPMTSDKLQS